MEIFKLIGTIMVDSKDAESSISKTTEKADGLGTKLAGGIKTAAKWGTAIYGAAAAVGTAMVAAAKDTADAAGEIDDAAQRIGIDAESYQKMAYAAHLNGVEMDTMEKAAKKLVGTDMNLDDAMDAIMSLGTETERSEKAIELFGEKIAYEMTPLLNAGGESFYALQEEAVALGAVMSNEAVTAGADMGDMFDKVTATLGTLKNNLMTEFMPYVMEICQWIIDEAPAIVGDIKQAADAIMPLIEPVVSSIMKILPPILELIKKIIAAIMPILEPMLKTVVAAVEAVVALLTGDFQGLWDKIKEILLGIRDTWAAFNESLTEIGRQMFNKVWEGMKGVWSDISGWVSDKVSWLVDKLAFWRNSQSEMSTDGSHAAGLSFVPYDGYVAQLHRGETVLNADSAQQLLDTIRSLATGSFGGGQTIVVQSVLDGKVIGETAYQYSRNKRRAYG